jgi:anion-transporting  ArsA/GET3 family ATPase
MASIFERKLLVVTGKGGSGKTTVSGAIGLLAARQGLRTIVVEMGDQHRLPGLFDYAGERAIGVEVELAERLWSTSIDPDRVLLEWLQALGGRVSARVIGSSSTFQYFTAAAPGAREMTCMVKVWELTRDKRRRGTQTGVYDLVVLDAPASGHALAMLQSPQTFAAITRVGPIASQARQVRELLEDPESSDYLAVTQATEMSVTETLELEQGLRRRLNRELAGVVVNGTLPRRFNAEELKRIATLNGHNHITRAAALAARSVHDRARVQHNQIARLRRRRPPVPGISPKVLGIPFLFQVELDLAAVRRIAEHLEKGL